MIPEFWPKRFIYARESVSNAMVSVILQQLLCTGNPEDSYRTSQVIENKSVHPHLQIKKITSGLHPLAHKKTMMGHENYGVFAAERIERGSEIGEYVGEISLVYPQEIATICSKTHNSEYVWVVAVNNLFFEIDAQRIGNELALVNDYRGLRSCPNVKMTTIIHKGFYYFGYIASLDIEKGEEVLVDYGENFHRTSDDKKNKNGTGPVEYVT